MYEQLRHPIVVLCAMIGMFYVFDLHYASFMCGVLLCYLRSIGHFSRSKRFVANPVGAVVIVIGILVLGGLANRISGGHLWFNAIMGAIVLYVIYCNNFSQSIFVSRISRALGAISFPVFLCQFAVIIAVTSYLIVWSYANHALTNSFIFVIIAISIIFTLTLANIFLVVERLTSRFCNRVALVVLRS